MVFDNCQIDVFFHMRSHYNRLRSVHSIVDCSAPKGLRRLNLSSTSLQYAGMAPYCNNNSAVKSHNCKYNTSCIPVSSPGPTACSPRAKSLPPRPGTRRHPDDMPFSRDMCSRSAKNPVRHQQESTKTTPVRTGRQNPTPRHRPKMKIQHHVPAIASVYYASKNTSSEGAKLESFHSRSDQDVRSNTSPTLTSVNQKPVSSSQYGEPKENPKYNTPISTPPRKPSNVSARDHEYLQFLLKITEDIIQNDLYTNKEMKKVFVSHFNANKERLDSDRMILQIHQLMQELNIPLSGDSEEDQSPSWSEIESALKGLGIEEVKQTGDVGSSDSKYKSSPSPQERCICFDVKNSDESSFNRRKVPEEEVENTNYDDYASKNKFQSSLDRLTEHTEPISSQATCKASTVTSSSTFGQVDVLPGFESLETPRTTKSGPTEKSSKPQSPEKSERKVTYQGPSRRKNTKKHKRLKKSKTSRIKRPKSILKDSTCSKCVEKVCQASIVAQSRGTDPHTKELSFDNVTTKDVQKPLIITMKDGIENQTDANNLFPENAKNDYTLIKGPIYLLKTFLVENPNLVMKIETPSVPSLVICKSSEAKNKIGSEANEPKNEEHQEVKEKLLPKTASTDEVNGESKVLKTDLDSTSGKYKEIRNILMQMTSDLSLSSSSSSFESKETIIPFDHFGSTFSTQTDVTLASKIATTSAMNFPGLSIKTPCRNQSKCSQFCSGLTSKPNLTVSNNKLLMTDAYDLTPQRDNDVDTSDMDQLIGEDYNVSSILQNFLLTREIQTEDLRVEPTIVAFARTHKDELPGSSGIYPTAPAEMSSTEEVTNILNSLGVNPGKSFSQNESKIGKKIKSAKKDTSKGYHRDPAEADNVKSVTMRDSVFAYPTSAPPVNENSEIPDEVGQEFQMKMMFPFLQNPKLQVETPKADSDEAIAHTRRVSIMRNPIIQLPLDKAASDIDDSKKKAESIMKAVDVFKERQATKGPSHLSKALQDMESSRESRFVEKMIHESKVGKDQPSMKPVTELLDLDTTSIDEVYAIGTEASSYVELPIKLAQRQGEQHNSKKGEDFIMDQSDKVEPTSSQIRRITLVTEKLDYLRNADDDDDYEISATLDQLALLLQQEQEKEEDIEIKDDSTPEEQSETSVNRKYFRCCNFRRKKSAMPKKNIQEPFQRDSFSEKQYRSKSEAFEMALLALGQASSPTPEIDPKATEKATGSDLMEVSSAQSIVLALGGTKLPALKLGPQAEKNTEGEINIDFDVISTMALRVDDEKTARYKF